MNRIYQSYGEDRGVVACCRLAENVGERVMEGEEKEDEIGGNFETMLNITQSEGAGAGHAR